MHRRGGSRRSPAAPSVPPRDARLFPDREAVAGAADHRQPSRQLPYLRHRRPDRAAAWTLVVGTGAYAGATGSVRVTEGRRRTAFSFTLG